MTIEDASRDIIKTSTYDSGYTSKHDSVRALQESIKKLDGKIVDMDKCLDKIEVLKGEAAFEGVCKNFRLSSSHANSISEHWEKIHNDSEEGVFNERDKNLIRALRFQFKDRARKIKQKSSRLEALMDEYNRSGEKNGDGVLSMVYLLISAIFGHFFY